MNVHEISIKNTIENLIYNNLIYKTLVVVVILKLCTIFVVFMFYICIMFEIVISTKTYIFIKSSNTQNMAYSNRKNVYIYFFQIESYVI